MPDERDLRSTNDDLQIEREAGHKPDFIPPKLTFVKPKLEKQGDFEAVTAGFFGTFNPIV